MNCSVCGKRAEAAYSITHSKCGHATHSDCFVEDQHDFKFCDACLNPTGSVSTKKTVTEPRLLDGRDYVKQPGSKPGLLSNVGSKVVSLVSRSAAQAQQRKSPAELLRARTPIEDIFRYGYGLDHMLEQGITIDDFIANRYKWEDLCAFQDVQESPERALETFVCGLKLNANHLKDYPSLLPFDKFKAATNLTNSQLCTQLGMEFPADACLQCEGKNDWNAKDCVRLGLTIEDLKDFGLYCQEQYLELMEGLSTTERKEAEIALGVTPELFGELRCLAEEQKQQQQKQVVYTQNHYVDGDDDDEEEDNEDEEEVPQIQREMPRAPTKKKPVVYEQRFIKKQSTPSKPKGRPDKLAYLAYTPSKK